MNTPTPTTSKHFIVVPLYDHTPDDEVQDILDNLKDIGLDDCYRMRGVAVSNVDRPHRFTVGDKINHVDAPGAPFTVEALTWRGRDGVLYPTYTIRDELGETAEDVLDTNDLKDAPLPDPLG